MELSRVTIDRVMREYRKNPDSIHQLPKMRGKPSYAIDASYQEIIRAYIRQANSEGSYITLETIRNSLLEKVPESSFSIMAGAFPQSG